MKARSRIQPATVVGLALLALLAGVAFRELAASSPDPDLGQPAVAANITEAPSASPPADGGTSTASARTEADAVAAAADVVTNGQRLLDLSPTEVPNAVREYASRETAAEQIAEMNAQLDALRETLAAGRGRTRYIQAVLATRLDAYADDRSRVSVWSVGVLWRPGAAEPQAGWVTSTVDLIWEDGAWKVWAQTVDAGPAPAPNAGPAPVNSVELERLLAGFEAWTDIT